MRREAVTEMVEAGVVDHLHRLRSMKVPLQLGDNWR
jgi:hypothetical protein